MKLVTILCYSHQTDQNKRFQCLKGLLWRWVRGYTEAPCSMSAIQEEPWAACYALKSTNTGDTVPIFNSCSLASKNLSKNHTPV